jgi:transcriptional regulator with XRE-family HTH domain
VSNQVALEFGAAIRKLRLDQKLGLRKFARSVGISPTFLCHVEQGLCTPPAEDKIVAIAEALGADSDELLVLAGRVPATFRATIQQNPREVAGLLRAIESLPHSAVHQVAVCLDEVARLLRDHPDRPVLLTAHGPEKEALVEVMLYAADGRTE